MTRIRLHLAAAVAIVILIPSTATTQAPARSAPDTLRAIATRLPVLAPLFELTPRSQSPAAASLVAVRRRLSQGQTLMIIGGSAVLAGILVGDDAGTILILGGVGIGGYGLYLHLNSTSRR